MKNRISQTVNTLSDAIISVLGDSLSEGDKKHRLRAMQLAAEHEAWENKHRRGLRYEKIAPKTWILKKQGKDTSPIPAFSATQKTWNGRRCPVNKIVDGTIVERFPSVSLAAKAEGIPMSTFRNILCGKSKPLNGASYKFAK